MVSSKHTLYLPESITASYFERTSMRYWDDDGFLTIPIAKGGTVRVYHNCYTKTGYIRAKEMSCTDCNHKFKMTQKMLIIIIKLYYF